MAEGGRPQRIRPGRSRRQRAQSWLVDDLKNLSRGFQKDWRWVLHKWDKVPPVVQAGLFGAIVLVVSLLLVWILWSFWVVKPSKSVDRLDAELSFGALYTAFIAILLGAAFGYFAIHEYREQHDPADLELWFPFWGL